MESEHNGAERIFTRAFRRHTSYNRQLGDVGATRARASCWSNPSSLAALRSAPQGSAARERSFHSSHIISSRLISVASKTNTVKAKANADSATECWIKVYRTKYCILCYLSPFWNLVIFKISHLATGYAMHQLLNVIYCTKYILHFHVALWFTSKCESEHSQDRKLRPGPKNSALKTNIPVFCLISSDPTLFESGAPSLPCPRPIREHVSHAVLSD